MTTRAELRARVRQELNDGGSTPLWPTASLDQWLTDALRELGRDLGLERATVIPSVAGQGGYTLPGDAVRVTRVEHPSGVFRRPTPPGWGDAEGSSAAATYEVWGGGLILAPAPTASGEPIGIRYVGAYAEPATDGATLDVPTGDEGLVLGLVCRRAMAWIGNDEAKRQRFERQTGAAAAPSAHDFDRLYTDALRQRRGRVATRRLVTRG